MDENLLDGAETTNSDEVVDTQEESTSGDEETTDLAGELEKARKANAQILARAKKAEEEVKKLKNLGENKANSITNTLSREEVVLIAKGYDDESLSQIQVIAKGKGISLAEAEKDPLFVSFKEKKEADAKAEKAKLGASRGSGQKESKPGFDNLESLEDHKKLWKEKFNQ